MTHPDLVPLPGADFGLDLKFTESRILMTTLRRLMAEDVPVLATHDGIIVPSGKADAARRAMEEIAGSHFRLRSNPIDRPDPAGCPIKPEIILCCRCVKSTIRTPIRKRSPPGGKKAKEID